MCFRRCAGCIGYKLLILALLSIVANILLYFPNGETRFASEHHLSKYVECLHGILGGGFLVSNELVVSVRFILELLSITFFTSYIYVLIKYVISSNLWSCIKRN